MLDFQKYLNSIFRMKEVLFMFDSFELNIKTPSLQLYVFTENK